MSSARQSISLIVIDVLDVHKLETAEQKLYWWIYWLFAHLFHFLSITKANASSFLDRSLSWMLATSIESHFKQIGTNWEK